MLKLSKSFGEVKEVKGKNGVLSINLHNDHYDHAETLKGASEKETKALRKKYYDSLNYDDLVSDEGMISLKITLQTEKRGEEPEVIYLTEKDSKTYQTAFADVKNRLNVVVDYEVKEGIKGYTVTALAGR